MVLAGLNHDINALLGLKFSSKNVVSLVASISLIFITILNRRGQKIVPFYRMKVGFPLEGVVVQLHRES